MDELVRQALAKWPNVPDCYGWLALDGRGQWRLGQERQTITNPSIGAFIARNYVSDESGRWLFQNGPQRVFVDLDYTPWIWRTVPDKAAVALANHLGERFVAPTCAWIDEAGRILLKAQCGPIGALHDHDTEGVLDWIVESSGAPLLADALEDRLLNWVVPDLALCWPGAASPIRIDRLDSTEVESRFHFVAHPGECRS
jgi:hypothetical protein